MRKKWRIVVGSRFRGLKVSNRGDVLQLRRPVKTNWESFRYGELGFVPRKILNQYLVKGYLKVSIWYRGKRTVVSVHRLVAIAFIPNPKRKPQINHIDGNRFNNSWSNLEWATGRENQDHAVRTGLCPRGEEINTNKLTPEQVLEIRKRRFVGNRFSPGNSAELASEFGVSLALINAIGNRYCWKHI